MTNYGRVRALCCVCGQQRTVSVGYSRYDDANQAWDDGANENGWRMTRTLKCAHCRALTRHALLRDGDPRRDYVEERMRGSRRPRRHA